ncbi:UDP-3-O-(3-hydroxymyristoyl)glucosamine N-acyltransferase [Terasakiella sp. A23]|uniref:UDP-3-O-(3-hydroxymyristoyl)glucosamine N-acyltransferase n=1 Tax=Terasakiella sp. FCG-A23 TaxID=3080561 RepID=UPI002954E2BC|nr:UDP-3-O-(3-hydroxymyristoyl)glucosamine N-acyltransferase [Terasakiella sp. A23]MDV7338870.1 UDP-3-O-(3-hydroxymyristoyl)glucosamine N-acyltransferase [Terasakiella sp. A23]
MADTRFFTCNGPFSAEKLAEVSQSELIGDKTAEYADVASLADATKSDVSFLDNRKYLSDFLSSEAGLCIVHPDFADKAPEGMNLLLTPQPYMAYAKIANLFYPAESFEGSISDQASVDPTAKLAEGVCVEAGAFIGKDVEIGKNTWIKANAVIRDRVTIGANCVISSNVTISHSLIGHAVTIHPGTQIGQDGFGFASGREGHVRIPQLGRVIIEDHVNIGSNTTIDRGAGPDTKIGAGTQIDNLVQIGHNVQLGMGCVVVSQVGISGSTKIGNFCVFGGQAGVAGHLTIGDGVTTAAKAGIMKNIDAGQTVGGFPAIPQKQWLKNQAAINKMIKNRK